MGFDARSEVLGAGRVGFEVGNKDVRNGVGCHDLKVEMLEIVAARIGVSRGVCCF